MVKHKAINRYKYMHSGDCYLYKITCSCGKELSGWTPEDAEVDFEKHIKGDA